MQVDLTAVAQIHAGVNDENLPNSLQVPFPGLIASTELTFGYGGGSTANSKFYVNLDGANKKAAFGTALAIKEFNVTNTPAYLFVPFTSNGVSGVAGVFTGTAPGQSGFGLFADVSGLYSAPMTLDFFSQPEMNEKAGAPIYSSVKGAEKIQKMMEQLNSEHTQLTVLP
jgi:hypothetical protein